MGRRRHPEPYPCCHGSHDSPASGCAGRPFSTARIAFEKSDVGWPRSPGLLASANSIPCGSCYARRGGQHCPALSRTRACASRQPLPLVHARLEGWRCSFPSEDPGWDLHSTRPGILQMQRPTSRWVVSRNRTAGRVLYVAEPSAVRAATVRWSTGGPSAIDFACCASRRFPAYTKASGLGSGWANIVAYGSAIHSLSRWSTGVEVAAASGLRTIVHSTASVPCPTGSLRNGSALSL